MHAQLKKILFEKEKEVLGLKQNGIKRPKDTPIPGIRKFREAISKKEYINLIAEIKFASPSAGLIGKSIDPIKIGLAYERAGASAISLITDNKFFKGDINTLPRLKKEVKLPILRKDFIIDEVQIEESAKFGADAILLIARLMSGKRLKDLYNTCKGIGMSALIEVHDKKDILLALEAGAEIIGINNRDLDTFSVDILTTHSIRHLIPNDISVVCESGIMTMEDIMSLKEDNINAVLVGTAIMKSSDIKQKVKELVKAGSYDCEG